jgi:glutathione S-transferase
LCYPSSGPSDDASRQAAYESELRKLEAALAEHPTSPFLLPKVSVADAVLAPYLERQAASLFYYKGFTVRDPAAWPRVCAWFDGMEQLPEYRGTQSDFHTHAHDLPPQMGACFSSGSPRAMAAAALVDSGPFNDAKQVDAGPSTLGAASAEAAAAEAVARVVRHHDTLLRVNPVVAAGGAKAAAVVDEAIRCALTRALRKDAGGDKATTVMPPQGTAAALRYLRDRISVPRDMSLQAARKLRAALEETAVDAGGSDQGPPIPTRHRHDQDPTPFCRE